MDGLRESLQTVDQMIRVDTDLSGRALAASFDIQMPSDEETGAAPCQVRVERDESIGNLALRRGHGLGCGGSNEAIANLQRTDSTGGKVRCILH
jgi:hypothetical protein